MCQFIGHSLIPLDPWIKAIFFVDTSKNIVYGMLGLPDYAEYDTTDSASADAGYAGPGKQQQIKSAIFGLHMVFIQAF